MSGQPRERAAWFGAALAGAALAMAPAGVLPAPVVWVLLAITFGVTPGVWLARRLAADDPGDARAALALLLAPFACGGLLVLARLAGAPAAGSARALAIAFALSSAWEALRPKGRRAVAAASPAIWAVAGVAGAGAFLLHVLHPVLAERSDGAFHAGVAWAALRALPPEDPFFAGLALRYFWGPHAWASAWLASTPALGAYAPFVTSSALALTAALLATGALARRLGAGTRGSLLAQALLLCGAAPFAWVTLAGRTLAGGVRGVPALAEALGHGADLALRSLDPGTLHPSLVLPLDKFVVLTPFAWGLAAAPLVALALAELLAEPTWRASLRLAVLVAAIVFMHPVAGVALGLAALVGLAAAAAAAGAAGAKQSRPAAWRAGAGVLLALLSALPWLLVAASGASGPALGTSLRAVVSVVWGGACLFPLAAFQLWRTRGEGTLARVLAAALIALVLPALLLRAGGDNQSKLLNLAFALAAAPAAVGAAAVLRTPRRRTCFVAGSVAAWLPVLAAMAWAYAQQSETSADAPSRPPAALLVAVREYVPRDAVLVDATQDTTRGAAPALAGGTGRALLWSGGFMARKWGHASEALRLRARAAASLAAGRWPEGEAGRMLSALGREIWVLAPDDSARASEARWRVAARADGVVLARFEAP